MKPRDPQFERIRRWLQYTFADSRAEVGDAIVAGVVNHLAATKNHRPAFTELGIEARKVDEPHSPVRGSKTTSPNGPSFYLVESTHSRVSGKGQHSFTGVVPMIRFQLAERPPQSVIADTPMGQVWASDVKLWSLPIFREYYGSTLGYEPARVDVWTPPRIDGARFGAILFMVVRDKNDAVRSFILGGGMAQGKTRVLYCSPKLQPIVSKAGYTATPFTSIDHLYHGDIEFWPNGDPAEIRIDIRSEPDAPVVLQIRAKPKKMQTAQHRSPYAMLAEAALRVCAIADARGEQVPDLGILTPALASVARSVYQWEDLPR